MAQKSLLSRDRQAGRRGDRPAGTAANTLSKYPVGKSLSWVFPYAQVLGVEVGAGRAACQLCWW